MANPPSLFPFLRQAAPRLSRHFFASCRQCPQRPARTAQIHTTSTPSPIQRHVKTQTPFLKAFRSQSTAVTAGPDGAPLANLGGRIAEQARIAARSRPKSSSFPQTSRRVVGWWLFGSAASVFGIVVFGGLTRLTESGLSITEWRPVTGTLPPLNQADWESEYAKYKSSPEFQQLNSNMALPDFKKIYWMEYTHRLWGRVVGLATLIPTIYFIARRQVSLPIARNLLLINLLIGTQGFVGWWMVKSGLKDDLFAKGSHPRVSQYRLAVHLGLAFTVYTAMAWNGIQIFRERHLLLNTQPNRALSFLSRLSSRPLAPFRISLALLTALIATTVLSGALVAGLDAGLIYNEFPWMGTGLTPPSSELWDPFYSRQQSPHRDLWWRNMLENPSLVQLDHRILATSSFLGVNASFAYARFNPTVRNALTRGGKMALSGVLGFAWLQVTLGLTTLLYLVPVPLAAAHQAGALALLTSVVVLGSRVWTPPRLARLVARRDAMFRATNARKAERRAMFSAKSGSANGNGVGSEA